MSSNHNEAIMTVMSLSDEQTTPLCAEEDDYTSDEEDVTDPQGPRKTRAEKALAILETDGKDISKLCSTHYSEVLDMIKLLGSDLTTEGMRECLKIGHAYLDTMVDVVNALELMIKQLRACLLWRMPLHPRWRRDRICPKVPALKDLLEAVNTLHDNHNVSWAKRRKFLDALNIHAKEFHDNFRESSFVTRRVNYFSYELNSLLKYVIGNAPAADRHMLEMKIVEERLNQLRSQRTRTSRKDGPSEEEVQALYDELQDDEAGRLDPYETLRKDLPRWVLYNCKLIRWDDEKGMYPYLPRRTPGTYTT